jgi:hypothetical protein
MKKIIQTRKDQEVWNMLDYLSSESFTDVTKRSDGVFTGGFLSGSSIPLTNKTTISNSGRENHGFTVDFNEHTIVLYAYEESGHNGDHYNCIDYHVDWSHIYSSYDGLKERVRQKAIKQEEAERQAQQGLVRMQAVLDGKCR